MLQFTSLLKQEYEKELEQLLFFNPGQNSMLEAIVDAVERFGSPSIVVKNGHLAINVEKLDGVQTLFALDDNRLVGILVYSRLSTDSLTVIHIVVDQDYSSDGKFAKNMLVMRMLELLRNCGRQIRGVKTIRIICGYNQFLDYSI